MQLIDFLALYRSDLILPLAVFVPFLFLLFLLVFSIRKVKNYLERVIQQTNKKRNTLRA
jgi:heme exporter protein D